MTARRPRPEALAGLRDKYREMLRLRVAAPSAEPGAGDARDAMRRLAARFPGALREIDRLPLADIEARIATLDAALAGTLEPPAWAAYFADYHPLLRAALRIKRMCLGCESVGEAAERVRARYVPAEDEPSLALLGEEALRTILRPSGGRLNAWAFERVAQLHGVTPAHVRDTLFTPHA